MYPINPEGQDTWAEGIPLESPRGHEPIESEPRSPSIVPLANALMEEVRATREEIRKAFEHARAIYPADVVTGIASKTTDANGDATVKLFDVASGFRAYVARVVVEIQGFNPGAPLTAAGAWVGLFEVQPGDVTGITVAAVAGQEIGSLLDFNPLPDGTDVAPCILTAEGTDSGSVVTGARGIAVVVTGTAAAALRQVSCRYKIMLQRT